MTEITVKNVHEVDFDVLRDKLYLMVELHVDYKSLDKTKFVHLLGYYPAVYQYASELYVTLIGLVRKYSKNPTVKLELMDKRDLLEQVLKTVKFQYDSLSRKITILQDEGEQ